MAKILLFNEGSLLLLRNYGAIDTAGVLFTPSSINPVKIDAIFILQVRKPGWSERQIPN